MSYVDENLLPGEKVVYRAHLHRIIYTGPLLLAIVGIALIVTAYMLEWPLASLLAGGVIVVIAGIIALASYIRASSSEFAVTNRRVVIKVGIVRRHTLELLLQKVEGIGVDQTVFGRMINMGTITVIGTGGSKEEFKQIANPLEFRHQVQAQTAGDYEPAAGAPLLQTTGGPFCSKCGTQNPPDASFCYRCGQKLVGA